MRDYRDAKSMAESLRTALAAKAITVSHSESLELIAKAFGFDNWNILSAKVKLELTPAPLGNKAVEPRPDTPNTLHCSFCGKSQHHVKKLIAGPKVFICDECVGICNGVFEFEVLNGIFESGVADVAAALAEHLRTKATEQLIAYQTSTRQVLKPHDGNTEQSLRGVRLRQSLEAVEAVLRERGVQ